jgi:hypothetical protein
MEDFWPGDNYRIIAVSDTSDHPGCPKLGAGGLKCPGRYVYLVSFSFGLTDDWVRIW